MKILSTLYADVFYDNSTSGLTATTISAALNELAALVNVEIDSSTVSIDNENFSGLLANADDNIQSALDIIDVIDSGDIPYDNTTSNLIASDVKSAIDALHQLFFSALTVFDGGAPDTNTYVYALDGGDPDMGVSTLSVDGGDTLGQRIDGGDAIND
jgi:hypothetical protein